MAERISAGNCYDGALLVGLRIVDGCGSLHEKM